MGDDAQSIYSFRGADFKNIMEFPDLFPGTKIVRLEENYRSAQPILEATNAIIAEQVRIWHQKVIEARQGVDAVESQINAVADVLFDLSECIKRGEEDVEVIVQLIRRENMRASLVILANKLRTSPVLEGRLNERR